MDIFRKIGFIGAGEIAEAIISSLNNADIIASRRNEEKLRELGDEYNIQATTDNLEVVKYADVVVVAVKPGDLGSVLKEIKDEVGNKLVISVAAGKTIEYIHEHLGAEKHVIRCMPNVGLFVGKGATAYSLNGNCTTDDKKSVEYIMGSGGVVEEVDEGIMDEVAALSGSGPAFVSYLLDNLQQIAINKGIPKELAGRLLHQTAQGVLEMVSRGKTYAEIQSQVATKGGITDAGIKKAEHECVGAGVQMMYGAAVDKAKSIGER